MEKEDVKVLEEKICEIIRSQFKCQCYSTPPFCKSVNEIVKYFWRQGERVGRKI